MASTLQVILPDDLETALAKLVPQGPIDCKATLEATILDLLDALQSANADVASLLGAIAYKTSGLLEVVIASRNEAAFTFRSRVLKALQKSSHYPNPIFITCTKRIGAFLISLPPWITVDQSIMTKFHAFSTNLASTDTTKSECFVNKKAEPEPVEQVPIKPNKPLQLGKRHQRASSVSSTIQDAGRNPTKSRRASTGVLKQPSSPTVATNRSGAGPAVTEELRECLKAYFAVCLEDGVEEYAITNLFQLLVPPAMTLESSLPLLGEEIKYAAKVFYTKQKDTASLHKASELCDSKDEFVDFLVDHGFEDQRIDFLESIEEHEKIAQVLWDDGDYVNAVLRFRESNDPSSPRQGSRCLLEGIRASVSLVTSYGNESGVLSELFELSRTAVLTPDEEAEIRFLRAVVNLEAAELKQYGQRCLDKQDLPGALLALDAWTQSAALEGLRSTQDHEVAEVLLICQKYGAVINDIVRTPGFVNLPGMQHVFGVSNTSSHEPARQVRPPDITLQRTIRACSFIHSVARRVANREEQPKNRGDPVTLPTNSVDDMIRRALLRRLNNVVELVDEFARKSRAFEICQQFLMSQQCGVRDEGSCWKDHIPEKDLTTERFNSRLRLHILVIAVLNNFTAVTSDHEKTRSTKQKIWITKLFHLCYPSINKAGCLSDIIPAMIPEYSSAMPIVQTWLQEMFLSLRPGDNVRYFLTQMLITSLLATAFDYGEAVTYLWRGQWSLDPEYAHQNGLIQANTKPAVGSAIVWLAKGVKTRINHGINFLNHVLSSEVYLDAEVLVAFAEEVCAQLILNHYAHNYTGYDYMAMPRSWIIRAFARAQSLQVNGAMPWALAATLDNLLNILLLNRNKDKLQMRGSLLKQASLTIRSQAVQRVCHCLALIGQNITGVRAAVLAVFQKLGVGLTLKPEIQRFARVTDWEEVMDALVESMRMSTMDELLIIRHDAGHPSHRTPFKPVVCPDEKNLLVKLRLAQNPPAIALQSDVLCPVTNQIAPAQRRAGSTSKSAQKKPVVEAPQLESVASTPENRRSASIIQAFFRRHRRRAGGPIAATFERLAKKLKEHTPGSRLERSLLLCLRGPMPHVLAYIRTLKMLSENTIRTLNRDMQENGHEDIEELHAKGVEVRRIRDVTIRLIRELQPSSKFYFNRRSATPVSTVAIVEKVRQVPELVSKLRKFTDCPEDLDYDLGVEPLLSDRALWAHSNPATF